MISPLFRSVRTEVLDVIEDNVWTSLLSESISTVVYMLFAILMIAGIKCRKRGLMVPYLMYQMLVIIIFLVAGICATVGLFFVSYIMGAIATGVVLIATFLFLYFWVTVQRAFKELGNRDYEYSPAPVKYNPPMDSR